MKKAIEPDKRHLPGGLVGMLAGLWGSIMVLLFAHSQVNMISPGTPLAIVFTASGVGFLYLGVQLTIFISSIASAFWC